MIVGKKVRIRPIEESDLGYLVDWLNDPEISHLVGGWSFPVSHAQQREWFKRTLGGDGGTQRWMVDSLEGEVIGLTGLWELDRHNRRAFTALKLGGKDIRGKGYGTDAIMALMGYAFYQVGLERLYGEILPYNTGSYRAYVTKCGWKVEGVNRRHVFRDGRFYDQLRVGILKEEFDALPQAADYTPKQDTNRVTIAPADVAFDVDDLVAP